MFREMREDADDAKGEPEKEILIIKSKREAKSDKRTSFAKRECDDHTVLHQFGFLLRKRTIDETLFKCERKQETRDRRNGERKYHRPARSKRALREIEPEQIRLDHKQHDHEQDLRNEQGCPNDHEYLILLDEGWFFIGHDG